MDEIGDISLPDTEKVAKARLETSRRQDNVKELFNMAAIPVAEAMTLVGTYMVNGSEAMQRIMHAIPGAETIAARINVPVIGEFVFTRFDVGTMGGAAFVALLVVGGGLMMLNDAHRRAYLARSVAHERDVTSHNL